MPALNPFFAPLIATEVVWESPDAITQAFRSGLIFQISPLPKTAAWIDRLSRRGLVTREQHSRDGRAWHLRATPAGRELVQQATERIRTAEAAALARLSPAEQLMLFELLHKVASGKGAKR